MIDKEKKEMDGYIYVTTERLFGYKMGRKQHDDEDLEDMTDGEYIGKFGHAEYPRIEDEEEDKKK